MTSHDVPASSSLHPPPTPPHRPTRPRLSRGISSRRPQPPPVPPSLRDHPLLDVVANGNSSSASTSSSSTSSSVNNTPIAPSSHPRRSHSRRSSLSTSPLTVPADKMTMPLPSPTGLWTLPPRPSPPIGGPWSAPSGNLPEPVGDAMGLLDTVPAGSTISAVSPSGYPWHVQAQRRAQGYDYVSMQHHAPGYALYPSAAGSRRPASHPYPHSHTQPLPNGHAHPHIPTSPSRQRHNHPVGTLHTHSPQPSPPITPAAA